VTVILADHQPFPTASVNAFKRYVWSANRRKAIHKDWCLTLIAMVERCRIPGRDRFSSSVTEIRLRTQVQRNAVIAATRWAHDQGLIEKFNSRVKVWCEKRQCVIEREATTIYRFRDPSEYGCPTASLDSNKKKEEGALGKAVRKARERVQETILVVAARLVQMRAKLPGNYAVVEAAVRQVGSVPVIGLGATLAAWPTTGVAALPVARVVAVEPPPRATPSPLPAASLALVNTRRARNGLPPLTKAEHARGAPAVPIGAGLRPPRPR